MAHAFDFDLLSDDRYMTPEQCEEALAALESQAAWAAEIIPEGEPAPVETTLVAFELSLDDDFPF